MNFLKKIILKVKILLWRILTAFFNKMGYSLSNKKSNELIINFYDNLRTEQEFKGKGVTSFVFSKDRAMQLDAFLNSFFENISNYDTMVVFFRASNNNHLNSYKKLQELYKNLPVEFVEETNFRNQLIDTIQQSQQSKILFYVDDMIFTHKFDYDVLKTINPYHSIVALSRGRDLTYSSVLLRALELPKLSKSNNDLLQFSWNDIKEFSDWSYPIGVAGYMYSTKEVLSIFKTIKYKAPNSLEGAMQTFLPVFKNRVGICTENAISVCIHANLTQDEVDNPVLGVFSIEDLLEKWNNGYQISYTKFYNVPMTISQDQHYTFHLREPS